MGLSTKATPNPPNQSSNPSCSASVINQHHTTTNRQTSAPILKNKIHKEHSLSKQVSNVATVIDELEYTNIAAKTTDLEEVDKETIHFLVFLFMQFISNPDQAGKFGISDEKDNDHHHSSSNPLAGQPSKAFQNLYTLLGYNENERRFTTMPFRIRSTPAINAFISNLPQVLDNNFNIGKLILLNIILILQKVCNYVAIIYNLML